MGLQILSFVCLGVVCSLAANLTVLLDRENAPGRRPGNRRLVAMLTAQALLFAGYGLLIATMRRQNWVASATTVVTLAGMFGAIPVVFGGRSSPSHLRRTVPVGLAVAACTIAAFAIAPMFPGD